MTPDAAATLPSAPRLTVLPALRHGAASLKGLVARDRLVRRLMDVHDVPLALLLAPAGYGKTTTLLEWAQHDDRPFAWVALHHADDDAKHLRNSVARATDPLIARGGEFVIVLDDVQVLRSHEAIAVLTALVEEPPPGARLVLASRCEPPLPLGRLRAHREVLELTTRDFVMTRSEAAALLELAGADLAAADVDTLVRRTEGWPAGLYLAAVSLREQPDAATAIARFGGDDRVVSDYVADSLLSELMAEEVAFLRRTSVLDRLSGPLCDAVLDDAGSARTLRDLARANGLVVPLDRTDEWYRYHGLLAQTLRAELRRHEPKLERELHRRASRWYADHDDVDAAIRHAAAAEDVRLAGDLLWANAFRYIPQGHNATVRRWLGHFTDEQVAGSVPLALVAANAHLADGSRDHAEHWTAAAARALDGLPARRADHASPRPLLEQRAGAVAGPEEVAGRPLEEPVQRAPRAVVGFQRIGAGGVVAHALHAVAGDRRPHHSDARPQGRLAAPSREAVERASGRGRPVLGVVTAAVGKVGVGGHQGQGHGAGDLLVGEVTEPATDGRVVALRDVPEGVGPQQVAREPDVLGGRGMADRGVDVVVIGIPATRAPMQLALELGLVPAQLGAQRLREQPVVAVPLVGAIQRHDEAVRPGQVAKRPGRARVVQHGIAQRPRQPVEHRCATQEGDLLGHELGQQRVGHVVRYDAIVAAEPGDRRGGVGLPRSDTAAR